MKRILSACLLAALATGLLAVPATAADFDATPHLLKDATPGTGKSGAYGGVALGSRFVYSYENVANGNELWITDGSTGGTHLLKDILPGPGSSAPFDFTVFKGKVYFRADDTPHGNELWVTDGTTAGTKLYKDLQPGQGSSYAGEKEVVAVGNTLYFTAYVSAGVNAGKQVWKTDGVAAHTSVVRVIRPTSGTTLVSGLTRWGNRLVFSATDDLGNEPWVTDGTTTLMIKDINPGAGDSNTSNFAVLGTKLFFTAKPTGNSGVIQIWHSDPPNGNLVTAFPLSPPVAITEPANLVANGSTLWFTATSGTAGDELWRSDGTNGGTVLAQDINPTSGVGSSIDELTSIGSSVYFSANDSPNNGELWRATSAGVTKIKEINPTAGSYPNDFVAVGSQVFFSANGAGIGYELFVTDGTSGGTKLVKDVAPGPYESYAGPLAAVGSTLFFTAQTPTTSDELWVYTTRSSTTKGYPKARYTKKAAAKRKIYLTVKVRANGTTPTGKVVLRQGTKVVGTGVLKNGNASIRITKAWAKGIHNVRAYYAGSVYARTSNSTLIRIKVK